MKVSKTEIRFKTTENRFAKKTGINIPNGNIQLYTSILRSKVLGFEGTSGRGTNAVTAIKWPSRLLWHLYTAMESVEECIGLDSLASLAQTKS